jgi:type VI secretion system secreted protein VgrG
VSFEAIERMGEPYRVTIELTHPDTLLRADYLGRDASFTIVPPDDTEPRVFSGCITRFSRTKTTRDFSSYQVVVEAHIARLSLTRTSRIFQHLTAPEIIEAILRRHGFKGYQFVFKLRRRYPQHAFRFQYQIADWPYIHVLMEQEGIYSYIVPGEHGDIVVFADDIDHYVYQPELRVLYRETTGMESGVEAVFTMQMHAETVPESFLVADYSPEHAYERLKAEGNVARKDTTTYGQPYVYGTHHLDQGGAQWEAQLRHEAAIAWQIVYEGESNVLDLRPGRILRMDEVLPDAPNGQVMVEVTHTGARDEAYRNTYRAIPSERRFRLKIEDDSWPKISGTLSARVTSPGGYKYAYLTQKGHYTVRLDCDFDEWNPGGESVPLRLAKPFAGGLQTGFHFPALEGTEAVLEFRDGNPDKPYISQFHHNSQQMDLVTNQERWLSRNVIRTQSNNKLRMEDWEGEEGIKLSTEHSGKSQLNLGYLVDSKKQKRGAGFELRTSGHGAIRVGKGLIVSSDDRPNAAGKQLDMKEAMTRLADAQGLMEGLAQAARIAQADAADAKAMQQVLQTQIKDLQQAVIVLSASASIALLTPDTIQQSAGTDLTFTAGGNADIGVLHKFTVAAGEAISLFAHKMGIKLFANKGKVQIQAQNDEMELASQQNMTISSSEGHVVLQARKSVTLTDGGGAYIKLENGNVTIGSPAHVSIKMANFKWEGPDSLAGKLPAFSACHAAQAAAAATGENSVALA